MKKRIRLKGRIRTYIQFTLYLGLLLLAIDAAVFMLDFRAGLLTFGFTIFYFAITLTLYFYNKPIIMNELISFATEYGQIQRKLLRDLELPYALLDDSGKVIWTNIAFENVVHQPKGYNKSITSLFPTITRDRLPDDSGVDEAQYELEYEGCEYVAKFRKISLKEMAEHSDMIDAEGYNGYLIAVYLFDETALHIALQEVDDQSLTVGMIYLDNYEEALESVEEVRRSLLIALIDRKVNKYIASLDGISKKLEKDKYLVIMRKKAVAQLQESRFDLLEEVKTVNIGNEMAVTISIGIGLDGLTYAHQDPGEHHLLRRQESAGREKYPCQGESKSPRPAGDHYRQGSRHCYGSPDAGCGQLRVCSGYLPDCPDFGQKSPYCTERGDDFCSASGRAV